MENYKRGLTAGIPIALGYLSVSFTFGISYINSNLRNKHLEILSRMHHNSDACKLSGRCDSGHRNEHSLPPG